MLSVTYKPLMLSVVMLNVIMLNVIMLSVVAPSKKYNSMRCPWFSLAISTTWLVVSGTGFPSQIYVQKFRNFVFLFTQPRNIQALYRACTIQLLRS